GTPLVSDPGYHLVRAAREAAVPVVPLPGASAMITALSASGLASDRFVFEGFLPAKSAARCQRLQGLADDPRTLIFYESTHRIQASLADMAEVFGGQRQAVIARELSKRFETIHGDNLVALQAWLAADANQCRGEFVVLVQGAVAVADETVDAETRRLLTILMQELPLKQAAALTARISGLKKNDLYRLGLALAEK
ncbi:MAG TPA: 16S rRNA (cytidine(1402)-2'-O)-methyltransferase, partial [Candidatus Tenderia electrophaga]|nr:16S rRNA (cytidine(1402)-2'-O)-methyltransferase [Candidatus Tenderia electrophaga]